MESRDERNEVVVVARGGIEAIVRAMMAHGSSARVQEKGCLVLTNLAFNAENSVAIAAKGGIETVVRAMGAHGSSAEVQEVGCGALLNLAFNAENAVAIAAQGGIEAVLRAMAAHESSAEVQQDGCWALENIARSDSGLRLMVREAGAVPLVEKALSAFPDKKDLQRHGKRLLIKLGARSVFRFW